MTHPIVTTTARAEFCASSYSNQIPTCDTPAVTTMSSPSTESTPSRTFPTFFMSHGGGPSFFMDVPPNHPFFAISKHSKNAQWLRDFTKTYNLQGDAAPKAVVFVSAHWETNGQTVRVTSREQHTKLLYDYGGFPRETYNLKFQPKGAPKVSQRIVELLGAAGIRAELDTKWEFDHGVFIPGLMIWPDADVPVVEISIDSSWDPAFHFNVGRALQSLKNEGILLIASGSLTHNFNPEERANREFLKAFAELVEDPSLSTEERARKTVLEWTKIPSARKAHPAEDHFVPYFVACGAAGDQKGKVVGKVDPPGSWHLGSVKFE